MDAVYAAGVLGMIFVVLWAATRRNEIFRIAIRGGRVSVVRGKVPPSFLGDLREVARQIQDGTVHAVKQDGEPRLVFSSSVDERTAQRLRNAFAVSRNAKRL
jgi:hypothetical protein